MTMSNGIEFPSRMADKVPISGLTLRATETRLIKPSTRKTNTRYKLNTWIVYGKISLSDYEVDIDRFALKCIITPLCVILQGSGNEKEFSNVWQSLQGTGMPQKPPAHWQNNVSFLFYWIKQPHLSQILNYLNFLLWYLILCIYVCILFCFIGNVVYDIHLVFSVTGWE